MFNLLLVALGGAIGATSRHLASSAVTKAMGFGWPYGTLTVNIAGSVLMGVLAGWLAFRVDGGENWRLFLGTGVLGGFTTFSAFSLETALMLERREFVPAALYSLGSVALCVGGLFVGLWLSRRVFG
ncbi:MAG: fluoride efflux transporter CrcB [Hyphomonadaceae bacterium]